jgi:Methyltransferase domain
MEPGCREVSDTACQAASVRLGRIIKEPESMPSGQFRVEANITTHDGQTASAADQQIFAETASPSTLPRIAGRLSYFIRIAGILSRNMFLGGNLISLGLVNSPRRMAHYNAECLFLYRLLCRGAGLSQVPIWQGLGLEDHDLDIGVTISLDAAEEWFRLTPSYGIDLIALCLIAKLTRPNVIFEIGTLRGSSALHFAMSSPSAKIYTLDLPSSVRPSLRTTIMDDTHVGHHEGVKSYYFSGREEQERIHALFGDSSTFDFSRFVGQVDLFFVDGAHSYEYVRNDTEKALQCVRPGGVIAWHDYGRAGVNGVTRWLHEFRDSGREVYRVPGGSLAYMRVGHATSASPGTGSITIV